MKRCLLLVLCALCALTLVSANAKQEAQRATTELLEQFYKKAEPSAFKLAIAVMPVQVPDDLRKSGTDEAIAAFIKERISTSSAFVLVDRSNLDKLLSEIELSLSGLVDPSKAVEAGKLVGADLFLRCSLVPLGEAYTISMELIETKTGKIASAVSRDIAKSDIVQGTQEYIKSSFQSQFGLTIYDKIWGMFTLKPYWKITDYSTFIPKSTSLFIFVNEAGVAYKLFPWFDVNAGYLQMSIEQFELNESGHVISPLKTPVEETIRYTTFQGSGISLGGTFILSPTPRFNIALSANSLWLINHALTHTFMDFACYDIKKDGTVGIVNRDIVVQGIKLDKGLLGIFCGLKAAFLISRRLSIGVESGYFWMTEYMPDMYVTGNTTQSSNEAGSFPTYQDKNGTFDFMGGFNVARLDGTTSSPLISVDLSSIYVNLYFAVHF